jgi:arylsulfatase A-like enzyme
MKSSLNRRDFLKLASLLPFSRFVLPASQSAPGSKPNIIVIVFDAFSARHTPFTGYPRNTLPLTEKLADRATIYHNHYAASNFTTPGTASLLTGTYPWTHRAMRQSHRTVDRFIDQNLFSLFDDYYRFSYTHNPLASVLLEEFSPYLDELKPRNDLAFGLNKWILDVFGKDVDTAMLSWLRTMDTRLDSTSHSLFFRLLYQSIAKDRTWDFPRGVPEIEHDVNFTLEDAVDWTLSAADKAGSPFLGYLHFYPPHDPYHTRADFVDVFRSVPYPILKKSTRFADYFGSVYISKPLQSDYQLETKRLFYDEFILYVDHEFNRLYHSLDKAGILDNTWLILTSDHGELFERQKAGHMLELLYLPLVHIPLMIFAPGQRTRKDVFTPTSATDILPSLLSVAGKPIPPWCEGETLPHIDSGGSDSHRSIFALDARNIDNQEPLTRYTAMIIKEHLKLQYYHGYKEMVGLDYPYELYDLKTDPEEMTDLAYSHNATAQELLAEIKQKIDTVDAPYRA